MIHHFVRAFKQVSGQRARKLTGGAIFFVAVFFSQTFFAFAETVPSNEVQVYVRPTVSCVADVQNPGPGGSIRIGEQVRFKGTINGPSSAEYEYTFSWIDGVFAPPTASERVTTAITFSPWQVVSSYKAYSTVGVWHVELTVKPKILVPVDLSKTVTCQGPVDCKGSICIVNSSDFPDLTANPPTATGTMVGTSFVAGKAITIQGSLNNIGDAPTPDGTFKNLYQISLVDPMYHSMHNAPDDTDWVELPPYVSLLDTSSLPKGASNRALQSLVFGGNGSPSAGTYWFRTCADNLGAVIEKNENNNCSTTFTKVTVEDSRPAVTCSHSPPGPVGIGATVTWTATPSGGSGSYTKYLWTYDADLANRTGQYVTLPSGYSTPGDKYGRVVVTDNAGATSLPGNCAVTVNPPDFNFSISAPNVAMKPNETLMTTATLARISGTPEPVTLAISKITGPPPGGTSVTGTGETLTLGSDNTRFTVSVASQNGVSPNPTASINLKLQTQPQTPLRIYTVELTGTTRGGTRRTGTFTVTVSPNGAGPIVPKFEEF